MPKLNESKKILAISAGGLVLCLAAGGGVWWAKGLVEEREQQIATSKDAINAAESKIAKIPDLERDVIILRENVDAYTKILPEQSEVTDFLRTTERFAYQSGVILNDFLKGATGKKGNKYSHYSYRLEIKATLWQFMKFMNLFESHDRFIRVVSFNLKSASKDDIDRAQNAGVFPQHNISLVLETFVYEGKNAGKNVDIPNYAKKRERYAAEIAEGTRAIDLERYDYVEDRMRRDLFVDPRPTVGGPNIGDNPLKLQKDLVDTFAARVVQARGLHDQWRRGEDYLSKESLARQLRDMISGIEQDMVVAQQKITHQTLVGDWNSKVAQPLREIAQAVRGFASDAEAADSMTEERLMQVLVEMRSAVRRGDYELAIRKHDEVAERLVFPEEDPRFGLALQVQKTKESVQAIVEFAEIPMNIGGVVVFDEGRSGLMVNGKSYEEGEYLDDKLLLKAVAREHADFVFRGFVIRKKW
jgi:Tfp pilus assembly protein PilO